MGNRKRSRKATASVAADHGEEDQPSDSEESQPSNQNKKRRISPSDTEELETLRQILILVQNKKISPKNAFTSVDMDAALAELREKSRATEEVNFSILGMSLDASSHVYGCRVENTYMACMNFAANFKPSRERDRHSEAVADEYPAGTMELDDGAPQGKAKPKRSRHNAYIVDDESKITKPLLLDLDLQCTPSGILARTHEADNSMGRITSFLAPSDVYSPDLLQEHSWYEKGPLNRLRAENPIALEAFCTDGILPLMESGEFSCYDSSALNEEDSPMPMADDDEYDFEACFQFETALGLEEETKSVGILNDPAGPLPELEVAPVIAQVEPTQRVRIQLTEVTLNNWERNNDFVMKDHRFMSVKKFDQLFLLPEVVVELVFPASNSAREATKKECNCPEEPEGLVLALTEPDDVSNSFVFDECEFTASFVSPQTAPIQALEERTVSVPSSQVIDKNPHKLKFSRRARVVNMNEIKGKMIGILNREWEKTFSGVCSLREIHPQLIAALTPSSRRDINFHIVFLALLSLANDEKLCLESGLDHDVIISRIRELPRVDLEGARTAARVHPSRKL